MPVDPRWNGTSVLLKDSPHRIRRPLLRWAPPSDIAGGAMSEGRTMERSVASSLASPYGAGSTAT